MMANHKLNIVKKAMKETYIEECIWKQEAHVTD